MRFRFTLDHDIEGTHQFSEPDGWKGAKIQLERDPEFFSLVEHYLGDAGGAFIFYGDNGVVDGGVSYVKNIEQTYGFDANVNFLAEFAPDDTNYQQIFEGLLELSGKNEMKDNKMQVPVIRDDFWARFMNRIDTPVNISDLVDLDGNAVDDCPPITVNLPSQEIRKNYRSALERSYPYGALTAAQYVQFGWDTVELSELEEKYLLIMSVNPSIPQPILIAKEGGEYTFDIKVVFTRAQVTGSGEVGDPFVFTWQNLSTWLDVYIQKNNEAPILFTAADFISGAARYTEFTYNSSLYLNEGDTVTIYGDPLQNFVASAPGSELILIGSDPSASSTNFFAQTFPLSGLDSHFRITADTVYQTTQAQGYLIHDLIFGVLQRIGLGNSPFYSEFLGGLLTNTRQYDENGCGWMYVVLKGLQIRQYTLVEKPFFISFRQIWDGINPILNLGLGYETLDGSPDHQVIRIEQKDYFVEDTTSISFSNVRDISSSYDQSYIFKTIKTGYRQWQAENIAGNDDPVTKQTRATRFEKTGKDINLESDFIAAGLAIETTRRTTREKTADYKYDNNNFIIALNEDDVSPDVYSPELSENYDSITGVTNYQSRYNFILSPLRNFLRWANYFGGCLQSYLTSSYKFVSGEGNYDMVSDYSCASGNQCQAIICDSLGESQDISLTSYNGVFGYFFLPLLYDIRIPMEWEEYETIRDNPTKAIGISQSSTGHVAFKIKILEYDIVNAQATIKAWPKTFFPIQVIESIPEMACGQETPPSYDEDYQAVLDYAETQDFEMPTLSQQALQNQFVLDLKAAGVWDELDLLYVFATNGDRDYAKINWKSPGAFTPTEVNTPTFTEDIGFSGNSTTQYLNTGWDAANNGVNFTQDECGAFCYINNDDTDGDIAFGFRGGTTATNGSTHLVPETSGVHQYSISDGGGSVGSSASSIGFFHIQRVASNDNRLFKNGSQVGLTDTDASTELSSRDCYILAFNNNGALTNASDAQIGVFGIGASLTGKESSLYTAWNTYFSGL